MAHSIASELLVDGYALTISTNLDDGVTIAWLGTPTPQANLVDSTLSGVGAGGSSASPAAAVGFRAGSFEDDWYYRVHVIPATIDLGHLLQSQQRTFDVWNAHFVSRTLTSISELGTDGLTLTRPAGAPAEPAVYGALALYTYTLTIGQAGPPVIDALYTFNFNTPEAPDLTVTGNRSVAFPFSAQAPISEELEWATDVYESYDGHEKRVQSRELPRQYFEMAYLSAALPELTNIRHSLISNMGLVFGVPVWQESRPLLANVAIGATTVTVTTTNADFRAGEGEVVMLWVSSTQYEVVEVTTVAAGSLTLARPTVGAFTAGTTTVIPMRLCLIEDNPSDSASRIGPATFSIRWKCIQVTDLSEVDGNLTLYLGSPVIQDANYVDGDMGEKFSAKFYEIDSESGTLTQVVRRDVPEVSSMKTWIFESAAGSFGLRKLLYAMRGRQRSFWLPTFRDDFVVAAQIGASSTSIEVLATEYGRFITEQAPFNYILIRLNDGTNFFRQITGHGTAGANETISINTSLGQIVNVADINFMCYLVRSRIASDRIQIEHRHLGAVTVSVPVVGVLQ